MPLPFLLEVGTEEIPDWMIAGALSHLEKGFAQVLEQNRLAGRVIRVDATPRRLVLFAGGLPKSQKDTTEVISGPPKQAGEGAAQGFARKMGVTLEELQITATAKGEYYTFRKRVSGRATADILAEALPGLILGIPWPKTMYWTAKGGPRFIRPIRWLVALLGGKVVPFEVAGVVSGNKTAGHRRLGKNKIKVSIKTYEDRLRLNFVLVSAEARRSRIQAGIKAVLPAGHDVKRDDALLETLAHLTEWPTPILGGFDASYLALPKEVLVTVMRHHQKYFSVVRPDGSLAPHFIAVMNTAGDPEGLVRAGNERVLRARFNDARFFWEKDLERKLEDRLEDLRHVTFQAQLGSYYDKTQRMVALVRELNGSASAERAALLSKCDLTTEMVKEFTELQGVVGGLYARAQGEADAVADAIYEHYKPVSMEDSIPSTREGCLVALADKLDTLRGCFRIGLAPTGSKDPFALRRAAQGVVKILVEGGIRIPLAPLIQGNEALASFFEDRVRYYFRDIRGYPYDEVNAAMAGGWSELWDLAERLEAVHQVRPTDNFEPLAASFKRVRNILEQAEFAGGEIDPSLFVEEAERGLYAAMAGVQITGVDYETALLAIARLRPAIDTFFDKVLVNASDERVRHNRLALLHHLRSQFSRIADFSEIVTSNS